MSYFFGGMEGIAGHRTGRVGRAAERASHTLFRALESKQDGFVQPGGGSVDAPARAPRRSRTTSRKPVTGNDDNSDGDGEHAKRPQKNVARFDLAAAAETRELCRRLYRIDTVMEQLDISRATLYRLVKCGKLSLVKIGPHGSRIVGESINDFIANQMKPQHREKHSTNG